MKIIPIPFYVGFKRKPNVVSNEIASTLIYKKYFSTILITESNTLTGIIMQFAF